MLQVPFQCHQTNVAKWCLPIVVLILIVFEHQTPWISRGHVGHKQHYNPLLKRTWHLVELLCQLSAEWFVRDTSGPGPPDPKLFRFLGSSALRPLDPTLRALFSPALIFLYIIFFKDGSYTHQHVYLFDLLVHFLKLKSLFSLCKKKIKSSRQPSFTVFWILGIFSDRQVIYHANS